MLLISSSIIQSILNTCQPEIAALAFYYFNHQDATKQDTRGLLSSLLNQFSHQSDFFSDILLDFYRTHSHGSRQPNEDALMQCLKNMISLPGRPSIYIIVDALDECPDSAGSPSPREQVLNVLRELIDLRDPSIRLCVTSRPEINFREVLKPLMTHCVSLQDEHGQRLDIADYVHSVVNSNSAMRKWPEEEKRLVIEILVQNGDGMYAIIPVVLYLLFLHCILGSSGFPVS
jgi:hypothetical protein